jgi:hypothetical protein
MMRRSPKIWPLDPAQWWRWRRPRLWRGGSFDPYNEQQVTSYAVMRLRGDTRDVFLLSCIQALDYAVIGRHLDLTVQVVEAHMAAALYQIACIVDLIERVRPPLTVADGGEVRDAQ